MKPTKIADKIITDMYRDFLKTGNVLSNAEKFATYTLSLYMRRSVFLEPKDY